MKSIITCVAFFLVVSGVYDVIVSDKPLKEKILGNPTESQNTTAGFSSNKAGQ